MNLTDEQISRAIKIVNIFETGDTLTDYRYAEKLDDFKLRGVTVSSYGFVVRMDLIQVMTELLKINSKHPLLKYVNNITKAMNSSFYNNWMFPVRAFIKDWNNYGSTTDCIKAQDNIYKANNILPSLAICSNQNFQNFWSFVNIFDTVIMQGLEGCQEIVRRTINLNPKDELSFMNYFVDQRAHYMLDANDDEWDKAMDRPHLLAKFTNDLWDFDKWPFELDCGDYGKFTV